MEQTVDDNAQQQQVNVEVRPISEEDQHAATVVGQQEGDPLVEPSVQEAKEEGEIPHEDGEIMIQQEEQGEILKEESPQEEAAQNLQ